jgi:uncharacterized phiE125 gp8 family phage protein
MKEPILITPATFHALEPAMIMDTPELRIVNTDENLIVADLIDAAVEAYEEHTGQALRLSTWDLYIDEFPGNGDPIEIPKAPLDSVEAITYQDSTGIEQTLSSATYVVDATNQRQLGRVWLASSATWPATYDQKNAIKIRFDAGFADPNSIPAIIKRGLLLKIQELYDGDDRSKFYESCWRPYRRVPV